MFTEAYHRTAQINHIWGKSAAEKNPWGKKKLSSIPIIFTIFDLLYLTSFVIEIVPHIIFLSISKGKHLKLQKSFNSCCLFANSILGHSKMPRKPSREKPTLLCPNAQDDPMNLLGQCASNGRLQFTWGLGGGFPWEAGCLSWADRFAAAVGFLKYWDVHISPVLRALMTCDNEHL